MLSPDTSLKTVQNNLGNWLDKGYLSRLKRDLYESPEVLGDSLPDYFIANRIYEPSYVSLEAALSFYGVIPEEAAQVTSVSTNATRSFHNRHGTFAYRKCKREAFTGYKVMKFAGYNVLIADAEKALTDYVYFRLLDGQKDFFYERFNLEKINKPKAEAYSKKFNQSTAKTMKKILEAK
jgi:predicted transcriptional regulator of viral defense system